MAARRNEPTRRRGIARGAVIALALTAACAAPLSAQASGTATATFSAADTTDALSRAMDAEDKGEFKRAGAAYREVLQKALSVAQPDGDRIALAMLGFERVMSEQGQLDSIVPVAERVLQFRPTDPTARTVLLRTLTTVARDDDARAAFLAWRRASPGDAAPYREYARLLLQRGRSLAADSVLGDAARLLGRNAALSGETAQLNVSLGRWEAAAQAYRDALANQPWLETAGVYGLQRTPVAARDSVRKILAAEPASLRPRRLLASLESAWGEPRRAWASLSVLPPDDSTLAAWREFGEHAEQTSSWLVARDAWGAIFARNTGALDAQRRAADAALRAGDAAGALTLLRAPSTADERARKQALLGLEVAALGELGRMTDAQALLDREGKALDATTRAAIARPLVMGWLRAGDLPRARSAMVGTDLEDDDEMVGWIALYDGDLATARKRLVRAASQRTELVDALGLLARIRLDRSPTLGAAFLAMAKRDSAGAAKMLVTLADSVGQAAPAVLSHAARLLPAASAPRLWDRIVREYPKSPEAPESLLAWARALRDAGDRPAAIAKLEQMLVDYTDSALSPQGRRELERLKGQVPPGAMAGGMLAPVSRFP
jgi:tetratricopeptide (TPR) repeat protein